MATGWLGWTPDVVLTTPLSQITLALNGKVDFLVKTNPWGSKDDQGESGVSARATTPESVQGFLQNLVKISGAKRLPKRKTDG